MAPTLYYTRDTPAFIGFQPEPAGRGTKGIIWTCLSTILLSSWSSYHGEAYDPNNSSKREGRKFYGAKFIFAFLFPEGGAVVSFEDLCNALQLRKTIRQLGGPEFANFSLSQAFICIRNGIYQRLPGSGKMELVGGKSLTKLVSNGSLSFSDLPTDDEIADKSKRDWTLKSLSIIQTLWFIVSVIARLSRGYPVSLYEDITVANAFCGVIEFACWFHCPQDIRLAFILKADVPKTSKSPSSVESEGPEEEATVEALLVSEDATNGEASSGPQVPVIEDTRTDRRNRGLSISEQPSLVRKMTKHLDLSATETVEFSEASDELLTVIFLVFSVLFSGIHIAAWNYSFPSFAEAWIWRGSSLTVAVLSVFISIFWTKFDDNEFDKGSLWDWITIISAFLYPLARLMMLVVALMSFRKAPARLYETPSWTQYWPHI